MCEVLLRQARPETKTSWPWANGSSQNLGGELGIYLLAFRGVILAFVCFLWQTQVVLLRNLNLGVKGVGRFEVIGFRPDS